MNRAQQAIYILISCLLVAAAPLHADEKAQTEPTFSNHLQPFLKEYCWDCHNNHSNRGDDYPEFKKDDVMGGVIVRVPLD